MATSYNSSPAFSPCTSYTFVLNQLCFDHYFDMDSHGQNTKENSPKGLTSMQNAEAPQYLFDFYGVPRDSPWGRIISDCHFGVCTLQPRECVELAGPLELPKKPAGKWPLTHQDRIVELQEIQKDPDQILHRENIAAAIAYHEKFDSGELCSPEEVWFFHGKEATKMCDGICWREGPAFMYSSNANALPVEPAMPLPLYPVSPENLRSTSHAAFEWDRRARMYKVPRAWGGTNLIFETAMSFDTGSTNLQAFPNDLVRLLLDPRSARTVIVGLASGTIHGHGFDANVRVLSQQRRRVMLGWYKEMVICVGDASFRLSGLGLQNNALITMDPANQLMLATTHRRWALLFSVVGNI